MTIQHAIKEGIRAVRIPGWHPLARVEFEIGPSDTIGYYAKVYSGTVDKDGRVILSYIQSWNFINDPFDGWEVWVAS